MMLTTRRARKLRQLHSINGEPPLALESRAVLSRWITRDVCEIEPRGGENRRGDIPLQPARLQPRTSRVL